jgi:hypothetical protein
VAAGVAAWLAFGSGTGEPASLPAPSPGKRGDGIAAPAVQGVEITVQGLPEGGRIFYDGARIPENPFRVKRASLYVSLRVEADGFEPFVTSVMPDADRTVMWEAKSVAAVAEPAAPEADEEGATAKTGGGGKKKSPAKSVGEAPRPTEPATIEVSVPKKTGGSKKIADGRKGTKFSEDFE